MEKLDVLAQLNIGTGIAELELDHLESYFVETNQWKDLFAGKIDLIYGSKGAGKSALYSLLRKRADELVRRGIHVAIAENPAGQTVFRSLETDPPPSEGEFKVVWKLYSLIIVLDALQAAGVNSAPIKLIRARVSDSGLDVAQNELAKVFSSVRRFVKKVARGADEYSVETSVDGTVKLSARIGTYQGRLDFDQLVEDVDDIFIDLDRALAHAGRTVWALYDRLDVAFAQGSELEKNALRALFRAYADLTGLSNISMKIFVRSDIWKRLTETGFAEASHLRRRISVLWDEGSLRNLLIRRLIANHCLCQYLGVQQKAVLGSEELQSNILSRVFPDQIDIGPNKPKTFFWMLRRTSDGLGNNAPRELIQLLESLRRKQISRLEQGGSQPESEVLFDRTLFKSALAEVSKDRYEQTFLAEFPGYKIRTEALRGRKAEQNALTLAELWQIPEAEAIEIAEQLFSIGFFERRGQRPSFSYRVPFVYWSALESIQGRAF